MIPVPIWHTRGRSNFDPQTLKAEIRFLEANDEICISLERCVTSLITGREPELEKSNTRTNYKFDISLIEKQGTETRNETKVLRILVLVNSEWYHPTDATSTRSVDDIT